MLNFIVCGTRCCKNDTALNEKGYSMNGISYHLHLIGYWLRRFYRACRIPMKLDIHAVEHCNLNCLGCTHFSTLAEPEFCDLELLEKSLSRLSHFQKSFDTVQILGGEPLLNPQLSRMIEMVRAYFNKVRLTLITNGLLLLQPDKLPKDFWETCRKNKVVIKLTQYPINLDYDAIERICKQHGLAFEVFAKRTEAERGWHKFLLNEKGGNVWAFKYGLFKLMRCRSFNCFQLVGNRIYPCSHVAYVHHLNKAFGTRFERREGDYVEVDRLKCSFQIRKMMLFSTPFCFYCGSGYPNVPWSVSKRNPDEWIVQ